MPQNFAYQMCVGLFPLKASSGTAVAELPDEFANYEWDVSESIIPETYDFSNIQIGNTQIEAIEHATITNLSKARSYDSGTVTPPQVTFATILPVDAEMIVSTLNALGQTVKDPFKCLLAVGSYTGTNNGVRSYDIFHLAATLLLQDGSRNGEALQRITGDLQFQECHIPIIGADKTLAKLTWTEATNKIAYVHNT